jgi:uncharacterized membrane protein
MQLRSSEFTLTTEYPLQKSKKYFSINLGILLLGLFRFVTAISSESGLDFDDSYLLLLSLWLLLSHKLVWERITLKQAQAFITLLGYTVICYGVAIVVNLVSDFVAS